MTNLENTKAVLDNYLYKSDKPILSKGNYQIFEGTHKESKLKVTIKILINYLNPQLIKYLKKLKECKSENVIRIYQLAADSNKIVVVTQNVGYGNLANALSKCERLEQGDAISVSKMLLNGYVDLLRADCTWVGTLQDVQFTETGIKLSWSNFNSLKSVQCIAKIIEKISKKPENQNSILPNPKNKVIQQLIKVSKQSASQISLHPQLKKKQKVLKKKGKNWFAFKELTSKNQYMEQIVYLAVSSDYGFIKVKMYQKGTISSELVNLNKTKPNFTKVVQFYDQNNKTFILSQYSNDGSLQSYVTKLKGSGIKLNQQQIQFCFFSLFEPLKQVQQSSIKSLGMLHIRNIFLQNNIPKIGQPIPINDNLIRVLNEREDVPDFYHPKFKRQPLSKNQAYDTYSLGVLLYKLMYTQYPIFPQGKVHVPTAPSYNKRLKTTLQILLNQGGKLKSIENKLQISQNVINQVKQNKKQLEVVKLQLQPRKYKSVQLTKRMLIEEIEQTHEEPQQKTQSKQLNHEQQYQDQFGCIGLCCHSLDMTPNEKALNKYISITTLQQSPYKVYRICTKVFLVMVLYVFLFYFFFLKLNFEFLGSQSKFKIYNVTIATVKYSVITSDTNVFQTSFNRTSRNLESLLNLNCLIDSYDGGPKYSDTIINNSSGWVFYMVSSLLTFFVFVLLKAWQTYQFDIVKAIYNMDHGKCNFNISNYIIFNLLFCNLLYGHYYLFNLVFTGQCSPCVGSSYYYASVYTFLHDQQKFLNPYMLTFLLQMLCVGISWVMVWRSHQIKYNKIVNPIFFFLPILIVQWVIIRIGVVNGYFYPNGLQNSTIIKDYLLGLSYINVIGTIPEMLWFLQIILGFIIDLIYWCFLDKRRRILIHDSSICSLDQATR